ncbi:MAG: ribosomal protein S18-alanine N-acetyltransferase [Chloroflexi bacterium]|nr:ribosomal protein S18-alanine N-acetyltransferase [Chloroflexota bacterium]
MLTPPSPYRLRSLRLSDLDEVLAIEQLAFPTPTKRSVYQYELSQNKLAHYQALCAHEAVIGYAGYWLLAGECHISVIATHPDWRRMGLGELLLLNALFLANDQAAQLATLEVRESNQTAQALYHKYQFAIVGERRRYYKDTGEDALIMTAGALDGRYYQFLQQKRTALFARLQTETSN